MEHDICNLEIILMRHGESAVPNIGPIPASEMGRWIKVYNDAGIKSQLPSAPALCGLSTPKSIVTSVARRARESVVALGLEAGIADALFLEADLPYLGLQWPRLMPEVWTWIFRNLWFLGFSRHAESYRDAQVRAQCAANKLISIAEYSGSVLLVGHGTFNGLIGSRLKALGWTGPRATDNKHWSTSRYQKVKGPDTG